MPGSQSRRLAAILAADIAGYSALMGADEARTVRDLKEHQGVVLPMIGTFGGRIIDTAGDGILAEFTSVVSAVECAVAIQEKMAKSNALVEPDRRMQFRIGINIGDVIYDEARIYGDGINVAARLEAFADPGGIFISRQAHEQVDGKLALRFRKLGPQKFKNIARSIEVFAVDIAKTERLGSGTIGGTAILIQRINKRVGVSVLAGILTLLAIGGGATWWWYGDRNAVLKTLPPADRGASTTVALIAQRPTVAVLPFMTLSTEPADDYFGDGLTEDIISALGRFSELAVLARNAVFPYKGKQLGSEELGRKLGARYLVDGSVRRTPDRVRVSVQLADASSGKLLWSTQYDAELKGIFSIQDDITRHVTGALAVKLTKLEQARSAAKPPNNLEAYDLVLRGREKMARRLAEAHTRSANVEARRLFQRAIDIDARYAAAYVGLGYAYHSSFIRGWTDQPVETLKRIQSLATTAIGLDASNTGAHGLLGDVYLRFRQYDQAIDELKLAIELNPSDAETYGWLGAALLYTGALQEAIKAFETAIHFDPNLDLHWVDLGMAYFLAGRTTDAMRVVEQTVAHNPLFAHVILAAAYSEAGRPEDAARAVAAVRKLDPFFDTNSFGSLFRNPDHQAKITSALRNAGL